MLVVVVRILRRFEGLVVALVCAEDRRAGFATAFVGQVFRAVVVVGCMDIPVLIRGRWGQATARWGISFYSTRQEVGRGGLHVVGGRVDNRQVLSKAECSCC